MWQYSSALCWFPFLYTVWIWFLRNQCLVPSAGSVSGPLKWSCVAIINCQATAMAYEISEIKKIGIGLVGFSILFSFLGVILFFDRGLLALGNIFFLTGVGLLLGWQSMWQLFTKKANLKGSVPFFIGLFLLFVRWPVAGIIMELYGSFVLFSGYGPPIQAFLYQIPIIGWILQYPFQLFAQLRRKRAWNLLQLPRYSLTHHGDK